MEETNWAEMYKQLSKEFKQLSNKYTAVKTRCSELEEENERSQERISELTDLADSLSSSARMSMALSQTLCCTRFSMEMSFEMDQQSHMFEGFLILGIKPTRRVSKTPDKSYKVRKLAQFPASYKCPQTSLADFTYPTGLQIEFLNFKHSGSLLYEVTYPSFCRDKRSFVICMKAPDSKSHFGFEELPNNDKSILYGCCVIAYEVRESEMQENIIPLVPICYCLLTYVPCFEVHFQLIYSFLNLKKAQGYECLSTDTSYDNFSEDQLRLLETYYNNVFLYSKTLNVTLESTQVNFTLPEDLSYVDTDWACPLMFSLLTLDEFYQLLSALALEKSIVFVSSNLAYISSCVLGLTSLLKPFKWPFLVTSVLPEPLSFALEAPVPFIAGISHRLNKNIPGVIKVCLDELNPENRIKGEFVVEPYANDLKNTLNAPYSKFSEICYEPSRNQVIAVRRIASEIKRFWNESLSLAIEVRNLQFEDVKSRVLANCDSEDTLFIKELVNTQMFADAAGDFRHFQ